MARAFREGVGLQNRLGIRALGRNVVYHCQDSWATTCYGKFLVKSLRHLPGRFGGELFVRVRSEYSQCRSTTGHAATAPVKSLLPALPSFLIALLSFAH